MNRLYKTASVMAAAVLSVMAAQAEPFEVRAAYLDFRTQVMTLDAMKEFALEVADNGMNAIVVEWEATFPFEENMVLRNRYAFSGSEVEDFISYCSALGVEIIPLQNCFGHSEYILRHERYAGLREDRKDFSQVCPMKHEEAEKVFRSIFKEIAAMHPSDYIHIGCDETRLLGHCPVCRKTVGENGMSSLYMEYVSRMCGIVSELGKTPLIWADIILKHPEAIDMLPDDAVLVDWNYGWSPDYFGKMENILDSGHEVWGACSLRSHPDNLYLVQWRKHLDNIAGYVSYAADNGFKGIINTSWSTSGTYGYIYDDGYETIDLQPVREVYPQDGFDMLMKAYSAALDGRLANPDRFLDDYCRNTLGLDSEQDIAAVKNYFGMPQLPAVSFDGKPDLAEKELGKCLEIRERMHDVKFPAASRKMAGHLELMLDIRINWLKFKIIDLTLQQPGLSRSEAARMLECLDPVMKECGKLRKKFVSVHTDYLKDPEQSFNEWTYYGKMENTKSVLENILK